MSTCYNDWRDFLPLIGCQWRAGSREAQTLGLEQTAALGKAARAALGEDWFAGVNYLQTVHKQEGLVEAYKQAVLVAGPAMLYQAGQFTEWTGAKAQAALKLAFGKQQEWLGKRINADILLSQIDPAKAGALRQQFRSGRYQQLSQQALLWTQRLDGWLKDVTDTGVDLKAFAAAQGSIRMQDQQAGYAGAFAAVAPAVLIGVGSAAVALVGVYALLKDTDAGLMDAAGTERLAQMAKDVAAGKLPPEALAAAEETERQRIEAQRAAALAAEKDVTWAEVLVRGLDILPWIIAGGSLLYFAPVLLPVVSGAGRALGILIPAKR